MDLISGYGSGDSDDGGSGNVAATTAAVSAAAPAASMQLAVNSAPIVAPKGIQGLAGRIDPTTKEVFYNPTYDQLYAAQPGPSMKATKRNGGVEVRKNTLTGHAEEGHVDAFQFEDQRRTFQTHGYALDPSAAAGFNSVDKFVGDLDMMKKMNGNSIATSNNKRKGDKRKRKSRGDPADVDTYQGPWAGYEEDVLTAKPTEEQQEVIESWKEQAGISAESEPKKAKEEKGNEKSTLHIKEMYDYQGRTYMDAPQDEGIKLGEIPSKCFLPKEHIHTWTGHTKGVSSIKLFPQTSHLLLSGGMDSKIKLWEVYGKRRCLRTFLGHQQAVRDVAFNRDGTRFVSAGYDRCVRLWDTETGECIHKYSNRKIPYCVKFHPMESRQHLFVAGTSDKKIICWDTRTHKTVQEYDRHLGAVNTITFVEGGRRMVSTSDDKSIRVWEWDIPVDMKYIAEPGMHAMSSVAVHPSGKFMVTQSMDNTVMTFGANNRFRMNRKKQFKGHTCAGYACQVAFSPDGAYVLSGDADGHMVIWDWKTCKQYKRIKAHSNVCIGVLWNPNETSKVITCGWDGLIKYWD